MMAKTTKTAQHLSYEEYLDEVTTLITEIYTLEDDVAIQMVMRAQDDEFFSIHDDEPTMCTLERAQEDARTVFKTYKTKKPRRQTS
jgi:hypothetical protein